MCEIITFMISQTSEKKNRNLIESLSKVDDKVIYNNYE